MQKKSCQNVAKQVNSCRPFLFIHCYILTFKLQAKIVCSSSLTPTLQLLQRIYCFNRLHLPSTLTGHPHKMWHIFLFKQLVVVRFSYTSRCSVAYVRILACGVIARKTIFRVKRFLCTLNTLLPALETCQNVTPK